MSWSGDSFVAERVKPIGLSGIRRIFELAATLESPINLSIGQPDFQPPEAAQRAAIQAIGDGRNGYTVTKGIPELVARIEAEAQSWFGGPRPAMVTCGVSGGLHLAFLACLDPGDEVLFADPYFVSYPHLVRFAGGEARPIPLDESFHLDPNRFAAAITKRTKAILLNSPSNPTGIAYRTEELAAIAHLAVQNNLLLISDEIYAGMCYDREHQSLAGLAPDHTLLLGGFGKTYGMTGWRMGYAAGPPALIAEMIKIQQYTFVCAPQPLQWGTLAALSADMSGVVAQYRAKRDRACALLAAEFEFIRPGGGFYIYPKVPAGFKSATHFVEEALQRRVLSIPGVTFSAKDTHFRISYATSLAKVEEGCRILCQIARASPSAAGAAPGK